MTFCWRYWYWKLTGASLSAISGAIVPTSFDCALAQITPDNTLGAESSVVTPSVVINGIPNDQINGGAIRGANLFHSFREFNVAAGRKAYFANPAGIENILSRVTGGNPSNILGTLGVSGNANLFLINLNGIIFGPNARLDIGGSFVASTASSLLLADGTEFSAKEPQTPPLLTVNVPIGLQFGENVRGILVQGQGQGLRENTELIDTLVGLRVQTDQTLALVGGDVKLSGGTLKTAGGRIELGSVAGPSLVRLSPVDKGWTLGYEGVQNFQDIQLSQQAAVDASGAGGGDIQVWGRRVTLTNGSQIEANTLRAEPGGTLTVTAVESMEAIGLSADGRFPSGLSTQVYPGAKGAGGNIYITAGSLSLTSGALLGASTSGQGDAGSVNIHAGSTVSFNGMSSDRRSSAAFSAVRAGAMGKGGDINITAGALAVKNGAALLASTRGQGDAGSVNIHAGSTVSFDGVSSNGFPSGSFSTVEPGASGKGGGINITTGSLSVTNGAELRVTTSGEGNAGNILVNARDFVALSGVAPFPGFENGKSGGFSSGLFTATEKGASSQGGELSVTTGTLRVSDGAVLSARSRSAFRGGNITVNANVLEVTGGGQLLTTARRSGDAGNITVNVTDRITISGSDPTFTDRFNQVAEVFGEEQAEFTIDPVDPASGLFASAAEESTGWGGNVRIETGQLNVRDRAQVTVSSLGSGNAGNLEVRAGLIRLDKQGAIGSMSPL
jgi:filamentous hemagglutinin family protein